MLRGVFPFKDRALGLIPTETGEKTPPGPQEGLWAVWDTGSWRGHSALGSGLGATTTTTKNPKAKTLIPKTLQERKNPQD